MSENRKRVLDDLDYASIRIGEQARTIAIGVLAVAWLFLAGSKDASILVIPAENRSFLLVAGALSIGALLADYFQYLAAFALSRSVLSAAEEAANGDDEAKPDDEPDEKFVYDYDSTLFRARVFFFWLKQIVCLLAVATLFYAVLRPLVEA
jgi:hypothetical protein